MGGDIRALVGGDRLINNSGITFNYRGGIFGFDGELRPLLRYATLRFNPSVEVGGHKIGAVSSYTRAHYRLPSYSEDLTAYEVRPYVKGKVSVPLPVEYNTHIGYSGKEYPLNPMKSYTTYTLGGSAAAEYSSPFLLHRFKVEGRLGRYNYIGLKATGRVPIGIEERSLFEYNPTVLEVFNLTFRVSRTLNLYSGILTDRSKVYRDILVGGEMEVKGLNLYLRRRREDNVFLHRSRSSDTRTLVRYVLGAYRPAEPFTLSGEISAIYTLYRFKPEDNSLYRYLDGEVVYRGRSELTVRVRMWDRGRYVEDSSVYYRLERGIDFYSSGWVPVVEVWDVRVGMAYDIKPEGEAVGVRATFQGGELVAMRRYENDRLFWQISVRFSQSFASIPHK